MSDALDGVIKKVVEEAMRECLSLLDSAEKDAMELLDGEMREANAEATEIIESAKRQAELERSRILSMAEVKARNDTLALIEEYVNIVIQRAIEKLRHVPATPGYKDVMRKLLLEGLNAVGSDARVWTNAEGMDVLKELVDEVSTSTGFKVYVDNEPIDCTAGLKVSSLDGKRAFDNTVEGRLRRLRPLLRREIARILTAEAE
ncbi:MAG: V-type ATP synthase subunit E family protein [Nitrososphaerota archaeon]|nr:V-type ATP synthase subunit E family protein [Aigarchaeota archaeon]MDW8076100.1 V-type ATP synthase subunit E family protein [Nitrososphaerota archaeon]